jgi:hypothetical protein
MPKTQNSKYQKMQRLKTGTELKKCLNHGTMKNIFFEKL